MSRRSAVRETVVMATVPLAGLLLWTIECLTDGVHDRYAIFPALCFGWTLLLAADVCIDGLGRTPEGARWRTRAVGAVVVALALAWAGSWQPSEYRSATTSWQHQLARASNACTSTTRSTVEVLSAPLMRPPDQWFVNVPCRRLEARGS
jgi:hypothetical protein